MDAKEETMAEDDKTTNKMLSILFAQAEVNGVAAVKVGDGQVFVFTKKICEGLLKEMEDSKKDQCVVFVKQGPNVNDIPEN